MKAIKNNRLANLRRAFVIVVAVPVLQPLAAAAQSESGPPDAIRECQRLPDNFARLACYDAALPPGQAPDTSAQRGQAQNQQAQTESRAVRSTTAATERPGAAAAAPETGERRAQATQSNESQRRSREEPAGADEQPPEAVSIVEIRMLSGGSNARFFTADGRIYAQASGRSRTDWPDTPFDAELELSRLGGTYLRIRSIDRRIRVLLRE